MPVFEQNESTGGGGSGWLLLVAVADSSPLSVPCANSTRSRWTKEGVGQRVSASTVIAKGLTVIQERLQSIAMTHLQDDDADVGPSREHPQPPSHDPSLLS
ncbi:hypothetical protein Dimus_017487 [Dionaea muscipula]